MERLLFVLRGLLVTGVIAGCFFHVFHGRAIEAKILGVHAIGFLFNLLGGNLRHSRAWLCYGRRIERWFISPAQHQLHHSRVLAQQCSNYGTWIALWDRLAGTLSLSADHSPPDTFGLAPDERNHDPGSPISALVRPFLALFRKSKTSAD